MWAVRWFFILLILVLLILFSIANVEYITSIELVPGFIEFHDITVIWIVSVSFIVGMLVSFVIAVVKYFQLNMEMVKKDRQISALQEELNNMRNLPLEGGEAETLVEEQP
jgi:uncharacterized integral membrane protein